MKLSNRVLSGRLCLCAEHVLQLACMVFKAEAAAVTLMGKVCLQGGAHERDVAIGFVAHMRLAVSSNTSAGQNLCNDSRRSAEVCPALCRIATM